MPGEQHQLPAQPCLWPVSAQNDYLARPLPSSGPLLNAPTPLLNKAPAVSTAHWAFLLSNARPPT